MDDFNVTNLYESKNEWASRLVNILTPLVTEGFASILEEAYRMCIDNDEEEKYLMTFQNLISNIPNWSANTVEEEKARIVTSSGCGYLNDLITCVHVIQLKILTCVRVGHKQKPIEIDIPSLDKFIHKVYINVARKLYSNVYLFEKNILPLQIQKHNRELDIIIKECILNTIRDSIPVEAILRAYLDETTEEEITEEIKEEIKEETKEDSESKPEGPGEAKAGGGSEVKVDLPARHDVGIGTSSPVATGQAVRPAAPQTVAAPAVPTAPVVPAAQATPSAPAISFSDTDRHMSTDNVENEVHRPKDVETLERLSAERQDEDDDDDKLTIHDAGNINLDILDINDTNNTPVSISNEVLIPDIEVL